MGGGGRSGETEGERKKNLHGFKSPVLDDAKHRLLFLKAVTQDNTFSLIFCGFHANFNLLKLTTTMEGGVINNSVAIKELPVTSFLLSMGTLQEAAQLTEGEFSCQSWSKYRCRSVDERRHRRASLPCQASQVLTFERQCCANSISVASIRELLLDCHSIGTKCTSSRP